MIIEADHKKIVVIDDDPDILEAIKLMLESQGYTVYSSLKGECALSITQRESPNLILLDVLLSGYDGREITKQLKQDSPTKNIPVILISADPSVSKDIESCGADDFIPKPFDVGHLLKRIEINIS